MKGGNKKPAIKDRFFNEYDVDLMFRLCFGHPMGWLTLRNFSFSLILNMLLDQQSEWNLLWPVITIG